MTRVIAVVNQKGGVGKTTTSVNVAAQIAADNHSCLLVDLDPQGNATSGLGISKADFVKTTYDVICDDDNILNVAIKTHIDKLFVLPSDANLAGAEVMLASAEDRSYKLKNKLNDQVYEYIIIDCPPSLGLLTIAGLTAATEVLIPVQSEYYALEGLSQLLQTIEIVKKTTNPNLSLLGIVITMFDKRNSLSEQIMSEVKNYFGDKLFNTLIPRNVRLAEAPSFGQTIYEHDKWSKGARAYKALAKEIEKNNNL